MFYHCNILNRHHYLTARMDGWSSVLRPRQHSIGYMGDGLIHNKSNKLYTVHSATSSTYITHHICSSSLLRIFTFTSIATKYKFCMKQKLAWYQHESQDDRKAKACDSSACMNASSEEVCSKSTTCDFLLIITMYHLQQFHEQSLKITNFAHCLVTVDPTWRMPSNINVIYIPLKSTFGVLQVCPWQYGSMFVR